MYRFSFLSCPPCQGLLFVFCTRDRGGISCACRRLCSLLPAVLNFASRSKAHSWFSSELQLTLESYYPCPRACFSSCNPVLQVRGFSPGTTGLSVHLRCPLSRPPCFTLSAAVHCPPGDVVTSCTLSSHTASSHMFFWQTKASRPARLSDVMLKTSVSVGGREGILRAYRCP